MSENVQNPPKRDSCDNMMFFPNMPLLSELSAAVPIRSDFTPPDGPTVYSRGVRWADSDMPGQRTLYGYNDAGAVILEQRMAIQCADEASENAAWAWLDKHCPKPPQVEQQLRNESPPAPTTYPPLRLI